MKYILDFDRVIFDTDQFVADLRAAHLYDKQTPRTIELLHEAEANGIKLSNYVHPGAYSFLKQHGHEVAIVSAFFSRNEGSNNEPDEVLAMFQKTKIEGALSDLPMLPVVYITARDKKEFLSDLYEPGSVFIDDEPENVAAARELGYRAVWMVTPNKLFTNPERPIDSAETILGEPKVGSFEQFTELVKSWESSEI